MINPTNFNVYSQSQMASHIHESNQIDSNSPIEQTFNFEKSATMHYLTAWRNNKLNTIENDIELLTQRLNKLEENYKLKKDDKTISKFEKRELEDEYTILLPLYQQQLKKSIKFKENLLSMGNVFQSEEKIKNLISLFLQDSLHIDKLDDSEGQIFWEMIKRETKYSDNYYVMYTAHGKDEEIRMLNSHIEETPANHICSQECFTKKVFRKMDQLEFKSLEEAYKKHIFTPNFISDHQPIIGNHFICTNLTLFGNVKSAESTITRFWNNHHISKACPSDNLAIKARFDKLKDQKHGVLEQIFIRKDVADKLGYLSAPYGLPLSSNPEELGKSSINALNAFQQGNEIDLDKFDSKYIMNREQIITSTSDRSLNSMSTQDYLRRQKIDFKDLQYRLMYIPELYNDKSSVLVFSNTLDNNHVDNEIVRAVLNQEIKNEGSPLSTSNSATIDKVVLSISS